MDYFAHIDGKRKQSVLEHSEGVASCLLYTSSVAPLAGAWIEIESIRMTKGLTLLSLPSRERGLKFHDILNIHSTRCRSPRGSVD